MQKLFPKDIGSDEPWVVLIDYSSLLTISIYGHSSTKYKTNLVVPDKSLAC